MEPALRMRHMIESNDYRGLMRQQAAAPLPDLSYLGLDSFARISMALLERSPMPIGEIAARTELPLTEIARALVENRKNFGDVIFLIGLSGRSRPLSKLSQKEGRGALFCEVGLDPSTGPDQLSDYVCRRLLTMALEEDEALSKPRP